MSRIIRRKTKIVKIGDVFIGGDNPIAIQSMTNTKTYDAKKTIEQIKKLEAAGCEIIRVSVPDQKSAEAISEIKKNVTIPLVADIHYDYRLAIESIKNGADKIRINPGNIGGKERLKEVVKVAKEYFIPIRIGVNCGSLEKDILEKYDEINGFAILESVDRNVGIMNDLGFENIVISVKSSDVLLNYEANMMVAEEYDIPIHLGLTEAGSDNEGIIRSSIGIGMLLNQGIGDTVRISLSNDPIEEVFAAYEIMKSLKLRKTGIEIISCPTCARTEVDIIGITRAFKKRTKNMKEHIKVAIMGCSVNGIGESKDADVGIAGGNEEFLLFEKGRIVGKVKEKDAVDELIKLVKRVIKNA